MNIFTISKNANENYLSEIIQVEQIRKHSNADKLQIVIINEATAIVGLDVKIGDIFMCIATESELDSEFLKTNNLYEDAALNSDTSKKGYINSKGRVRAISLRGENSRLLLLPLNTLTNWIPDIILPSDASSLIGIKFDTISGKLFSKKYEPHCIKQNIPTQKGFKFFNNFYFKFFSKKKTLNDLIIPSQFRFHVDTAMLANHYKELSDDDFIQITKKYHGTSGIAAYVLTNKKLNKFQKYVYKLLGIPTTEYNYVSASRKLVRLVGNQTDYSNVWNTSLSKLKFALQKGMTIYYELIGYDSNTGKMIQNGYDYGCKFRKSKILVYRITLTNPDGDVHEFSTQELKSFCSAYNLETPKELFYGKFKDFHNGNNPISVAKSFSEMEQNDSECKNKVPFEGLVFRIETWKDVFSLKLKSDKFYGYETKELDKDEADVLN